MFGEAGAVLAALIFFASQAAAVPPVAHFAPPLGPPAYVYTGTYTGGSGCGAAVILVAPAFNLGSGKAALSVRADSCPSYGTHTAEAWAGFNGAQFLCVGGRITGPNELWANWTIPYKLTDTFYCTGPSAGSSTISNAASASLVVVDQTTGGTLVASVTVTVATNNLVGGPCGTTVVAGIGLPPTSVVLWAALTIGHTYWAESYVTAIAECEVPNAASAACTAIGDLTYQGGPTFLNLDVS